MTRRNSTKPFELTGFSAPDPGDAPLATVSEWSFGREAEEVVINRAAATPPPDIASTNTDPHASDGPQRIRVPSVGPTARPTWNTYRRSMKALTRWEGVVEKFTNNGFAARLIPIENGRPDQSRVEVTEFDWDELTIPQDVEHVRPGSVFYWALVRRTREGGSQQKTSELRFRRTPPPNRETIQRAAAEARAIVEKFGPDSST